jgi:peptide chain release factor 3
VFWPIGGGHNFQGVYDRWTKQLHRFERASGARPAPMETSSLDDPALVDAIGAKAHQQLVDELDLLDTAGHPFDREKFLAGEVTPVFFGSAGNNFGVQPFLDSFVELAPGPRPRATTSGVSVPADDPRFSAFVFKIQANMDPHHRDRVAFVRISSGRFRRGMEVMHVRTQKQLTLSRPMHFQAQERTVIEEAFSGDIVGLWDPGVLRIGDTLGDDGSIEYEGVPRFSPEHFVRVRLVDPLKRKQLKKGLDQLSEEGAVQMFFDRKRLERDPVLGAIGVLQFEVTQHRLKAEYGVAVAFDALPYVHARWIEGAPEDLHLEKFERFGRSTCVLDVEDRPLVLFENDWGLRTAVEDHPKLKFIAAVQPGRSVRSAA